jgi:hypothetical protein
VEYTNTGSLFCARDRLWFHAPVTSLCCFDKAAVHHKYKYKDKYRKNKREKNWQLVILCDLNSPAMNFFVGHAV